MTLQHIAEQVGVSKVTVSKALNNKEGVSEELRLKIWEVAQAIGYKFVVAKEGEKSKNVGIIIHEKYIMGGGPSTFYLKFYQELAIKLNQKGYICNLFTITHIEDERNILPPMLTEASLTGVIAVGNLSKSYISLLENLNIPVVFLDCYYSDHKMDC
ncbi:MAG: LacI family DNA-binding transcriptional regulator, partial [Cellulosilyticaceae bacterium]